MNKYEQELFFKLCSFKSSNAHELEDLLQYATPSVLGHLFYNRMQAIAYGVLHECNLLSHVSREFRNAIAVAYQQNIEQNKSFFQCIDMVSELLKECKGEYAMLKGALLCRIYPEGYRTSNDLDLLVRPRDVSKIGAILKEAGFRQGSICNGKFVPARRSEVIESKMMRGETIPYIMEVNLPNLQFFEVDINFSLDYKNSYPGRVSSMIEHATEYKVGGSGIVALAPKDFFIHLCSHLYKEATTLPWVKLKRDMTLYKFCDIYMLLHDFNLNDIHELFQYAAEINMADICSSAIIWTCDLFDLHLPRVREYAEYCLSGVEKKLHEVTAPKDKKALIYSEKDIRARFFADNRAGLLEERS